MKKTYQKPEMEIVPVNIEAPLLNESYDDELTWITNPEDNNHLA
jgi:hypothetical protein